MKTNITAGNGPFEETRIFHIPILVAAVSGSVAACAALIWAWFSTDAGYYIPVARDIADGLVPFRDFALDYTPLASYIFALPYRIAPQPPYEIFLGIQFLFLAAGSLLLYRILETAGYSATLALFSGLFYFVGALASGGVYIALEPFSVAFGLAGLAACTMMPLRASTSFLAGMFCALAFLSKQYGLLFCFPAAAAICMRMDSARSRLSMMAVFVSGLTVATGAFLGYYVLLKETSLNEILQMIMGSSYVGWAKDKRVSLLTYLIGGITSLMLLTACGALFYLGGLKVKDIWNKHQRVLTIGVTGLAASALPLIVRHYEHYHIYSLPFLLLIVAAVLDECIARGTGRSGIVVIIALVLAMGALSTFRSWKYHEVRNHQKQTAAFVCQYVPQGSYAVLVGNRHLFFDCNIRNGAPQGSYSFLTAFREEWPLIRDGKMGSRAEFLVTEAGIDGVPARELESHYEKIAEKDDIIVYRQRTDKQETRMSERERGQES